MKLKKNISAAEEKGLLEWVEQAAAYPKTHPKEHAALLARLDGLLRRVEEQDRRLAAIESQIELHLRTHPNLTMEDGMFVRKIRKAMGSLA